MTETPSTHELLLAATAGDRDAQGNLVDRYRDRLEALVENRIGAALRGKLDREDVTQETFRRALESLERFEWQGEDSFMRWLSGIAENLIRTAARREERRPTSTRFIELPDNPTSPSVQMRRDERLGRLEQALERLPKDYRQVLRLTRLGGLRIAEAAERLGRSEAATKKLVARALRSLKDSFGDTESLRLPPKRLDLEGEE